MKLISYKLRGKPGDYRIGSVIDDRRIIDVQDAYRQLLLSNHQKDGASAIEQFLPSDPDKFYSMGKIAVERAGEALDFCKDSQEQSFIIEKEDTYIGPPVPNPSKIICIGTNYADHVAEMKSDIPEFPVLFAKFNNALIGPDDNIHKPSATEKLDYEVELAVVIGQEASRVKKEQALQYIAGYSIGNDTSARDLQKRTPQWLQGKSLDNSTPVGPWLVTADEIPDPSQLAIRSYVNGEERQSSNTSKLIFDIPTLIDFISHLITLKPGDIILTGTPDGVGFAMDPPAFLKEGDTVRMEIEKIGVLENNVVESK
ncbi:fumarylacetoacetate hydrolase family protein [Sediminibacillus massiliensis]|uniref:fumarylacetoacetate hydrolase family protein n=1 Tax=Sediminibacillus massiliensis TaxID=1926277 RepID=UPI000988815C|nr:fumarylacetoacetate hydrolase family protein [Sediminibacillus massiliensis]